MRTFRNSSGSGRTCPRARSRRGATRGAGLLLAAALLTGATASAQTLTYGPILGRGYTPDQTIVRWGTSGTADATAAVYRKKGDTMWLPAGGAMARDHEVILTGLAPGQTYEYEVRSLATPEGAAFTTCPLPGRPMDFVFYGDSRTGSTEHAKVIAMVAAKAPEMVFESGDIVPSGTYAQYLSEFFPVAKNLIKSTPFMAAPGNHDAISSLPMNYGLVFPSPRASGAAWASYYAFSCGNSKFIGLDSNINMVGDAAQLKFLTDQLKAARDDAAVDHVFVWLHHAPYSVGTHGDNTLVQSKLVPTLNVPEYKVTAVFSGHDHLYARMDDSSGVFYIVSGGAGADLYPDSGTSKAKKVISKKSFNFVSIHLAGRAMSAVAYDDTGTEIDRFAVTKGGMPMDGGASDGGIHDAAMPDSSHGEVDGSHGEVDGSHGGVDGGAPLPDLAMEPPPAGGCTVAAVGGTAPRGMSAVGALLLLGGALLLRRRARQDRSSFQPA